MVCVIKMHMRLPHRPYVILLFENTTARVVSINKVQTYTKSQKYPDIYQTVKLKLKILYMYINQLIQGERNLESCMEKYW